MESPGYAYELAKFQVGLRFEDLPLEVVKKASDCVLDQLGVQIKGSTLDWGKLAAEFVYAYQGKPESTILNYGYRVPAFDAVYANATFGHGCELDDYDTNGLGAHSGVATVPVAMALSELVHRRARRRLRNHQPSRPPDESGHPQPRLPRARRARRFRLGRHGCEDAGS
jgi:2-methylcitrate dehydratase PrpD